MTSDEKATHDEEMFEFMRIDGEELYGSEVYQELKREPMTRTEMLERIKVKAWEIGDKTSPGVACKMCDKSYCCINQEEIAVASKEFEDIKHLITEEQIQRAEKEIMNPRKNFGKDVYTCPFLGQYGGCEIYENRFMICAAHTVVNDNVIQCDTRGSERFILNVDPGIVFEKLADEDEEFLEYVVKATEYSYASDILHEFSKIIKERKEK